MSVRSPRTDALALSIAVVALAATGCGHSGGSSAWASSSSVSPPQSVAPAVAIPATPPPPKYGTRRCWPIVLAHGFDGFKRIGPVDYWWKVTPALRARGFEIQAAQVTPVATVESRARALADQILKLYPDPRVKVNLIGHSMGGLDARWAVSRLGLGAKVASVTTLGTPHRGSSVADVIFGIVPGPIFDATNVLCGFLGWDLNGGKQLTTWQAANVLNPQMPDDPRVAYFSWAGVADPVGASGCTLEASFLPTWSIVENIEGANDGLVSVASAKWGTFRGVVPADHLNLVGQPFGLTSPSFDHVAFFEKWADELEARGFGP